jgi:hypothetical protein
MRSLILSLVLGAASLVGLLAISPSQAEAQRFGRRWYRPYSSFYYPGYTYSYGYAYPSYSYSWGYPSYSYYGGYPTYYPRYGTYYSPGYSSYYTPGYYGYYWGY